MAYPMGESKEGCLRVDFDRRLKLEFHGSKITSDAGLLADRELDHALGLTGMAGSILTEARRGKNIRHLVGGLIRQSLFGRLAGCEGVNDAERLSLDPAIPGSADRALRFFFALKVSGHEVAERIVELVTQIDELEHERATFEETERGWERKAA